MQVLHVLPRYLHDTAKYDDYNAMHILEKGKEKMKGLMVSIYVNKEFGDCSNGGISSKFNKAILIWEGCPEIFEADDLRCPAVELRKKIVLPNTEAYYYAVPLTDELAHQGDCGPMMGGAFIYTSDSRFPSRYPIPLHDRWESWKGYRERSK